MVPPDRLGEYELIGEIARGGMGVVFRARQPGLARIVAVKTILPGRVSGVEQAKRFRIEAEQAARLRHPNIVAIHTIGEDNGQLYFSMDYLPGGTLADLVRTSPLEPRRAASIVQALAEAVQHAHEQNVLHRDLKPTNVLLDAKGDPVITDFGLARPLEGAGTVTLPGQLMGSPSYLPPEQAGAPGPTDRRSDIYGLGGILYFLLAARPAFLAASLPETLRQVLQDDPVSPRLLNRAVPRDLETITLKCLAKEPAQRYETARELADELHRFLQDEPIRARPAGPFERLRRYARRRPALAAIATLAATLLLTVLIGSPLASFRIRRERIRTEQLAQQLAERAYASDIRSASADLLGLRSINAGEILANIQRSRQLNPLRGWDWRHLASRWRAASSNRLQIPGAGLASLQFSPAYPQLATIDESGTVRIWDDSALTNIVSWRAHTNSTGATARPASPHHSLRYSPDGTRLVTGGPDGFIRFWPPLGTSQSGLAPSASFHLKSGPVVCLDYSTSGHRLAALTASGRVHLLDTSAGQPRELSAWDTGIFWPQQLRFIPDSPLLAVSGDQSIAHWSVDPAGKAMRVERDIGARGCFALSPDHRLLASSLADQAAIGIWHLPAFDRQRHLPFPRSAPAAMSFTPDGQHLVAVCFDGTATTYDVATGTITDVSERHSDRPTCLDVSQRTGLVASIAWDRTVRVSNPGNGGARQFDVLHGTKVQAIAFVDGSKRFVTVGRVAPTGSARGVGNVSAVRLWDLASRTPIASFTNTGAALYNSVAVSADSTLIAVNDVRSPGDVHAAFVRLLRLPALEPVGRIDGAHAWLPPAGGLVLARGTNLWQCTLDGAPIRLVARLELDIQRTALSPGGECLALRQGHENTGITTVSLSAPGISITRFEHEESIHGIAFSPDRRLLATASWDHTVGLWHAATTTLTHRLRGHRAEVECVAFDPAGTVLASGSLDGHVIFWDLRTRAVLMELPAQPEGVTALEFSPDGHWLLVGGFDGSVRMWHAPGLDEFDAWAE